MAGRCPSPPAGDDEPAATFATDGTCTNYAFLAAADTRYTASLDGERAICRQSSPLWVFQ